MVLSADIMNVLDKRESVYKDKLQNVHLIIFPPKIVQLTQFPWSISIIFAIENEWAAQLGSTTHVALFPIALNPDNNL